MSTALTIDVHTCVRLHPTVRRQVIDFATAVSEGRGATGYVARRLRTYDRVWIARRGEAVEGVLLTQHFSCGDADHTYLGPMFSRGGALVRLFEAVVHDRIGCGVMHLAAEIEHKRVLATLRSLVPGFTQPRPQSPPSAAARRTAAVFAAVLGHIDDLDPATLSTRPCEPLVPGRAQLVVVSCGGSEHERARLLSELRAGVANDAARRAQRRRPKNALVTHVGQSSGGGVR